MSRQQKTTTEEKSPKNEKRKERMEGKEEKLLQEILLLPRLAHLATAAVLQDTTHNPQRTAGPALREFTCLHAGTGPWEASIKSSYRD